MIAAKSSFSLFLARGPPLSFGAFRTYALLTSTLGVYTRVSYTCIRVYTRQRVGTRSRVRAGANEIGEIRSARRSADGGCRPSLSDSSAYRVVVVVVSHFRPRRAMPLRTASRRLATTTSGLGCGKNGRRTRG